MINGLFGNTSYTYQITTYYTTGAMWVSEEYPFKTTAPKSGEFMMRVQRSDSKRKEMFCSVHVCSYVRLFCEDNVPTTYFIYVVHRFCCFFSAAYFKGPFTYCYTDSRRTVTLPVYHRPYTVMNRLFTTIVDTRI